MKVLVTGDGGYIGAVLVPFFLAAGHQVDGLDAGWYDGCDLGPAAAETAGSARVDMRDVTAAQLSQPEGGEHRIRHGVMWRKTSFGTDSPSGSRFVERILTVVTTLRMQRRNVLDYVTAVCEAALHGHAPPSLLPAEPPAS